MDAGEILPSFSGIAMHDGWKSYDAYTDCRHVFCNAHLLRDLQGIKDNTGQKWAKYMQEFLTQALKLKKQYKGILPKAKQQNLFTVYQSILKEQPVLSAELKKKGLVVSFKVFHVSFASSQFSYSLAQPQKLCNRTRTSDAKLHGGPK